MNTLQKAALASSLFLVMGYSAEASEPVMLPEVVVTATRTANAIEKVPAAVEVITEKEIKRSGAYDLRTLLARESGVSLKAPTMVGGSEVMIRGSDTDKTLILVDGRRLVNEADAKGLGNKNALGRINLGEVERIEIVKGPSSAIYGSDAIGGVVHIITKKSKAKSIEMGGLRTTAEAETRWHFDTGRLGKVSLTADVRLNKAFAYEEDKKAGPTRIYDVNVNYALNDHDSFHAYYSHYGSELNYYEARDNSMIGGHSGGGHPGMKPGGGHSGMNPGSGHPGMKPGGGHPGMNLGGGHPGMKPGTGHPGMKPGSGHPGMNPGGGHPGMKPESGHPGMNPGSGHPGMKPEGKPGKNHEDQFRKHEYGISFHTVHDTYKGEFRIYGGAFDWQDTIRWAKNGKLNDINVNHNKLSAVEGQLTFSQGKNHRFTVGGEYVYQEAEGTNLGDAGKDKKLFMKWTDIAMGKPVVKEKWTSHQSIATKAAYIQDEISEGKWFIVPALRYDSHSLFGGHISPKIGASYDMGKGARIKVNYGEGFKAPGMGQLYYDMKRSMGFFTVNVKGNPKLKPETSRNFDISIEKKSGAWHHSLSYYDNHIDNLIASKKISETEEKYQFENINRARIRGVEHGLSYAINDKWEVRLVSEWMDAKDTKNQESLEGRPAFTQTAKLVYDSGSTHPFSAMLWVDRVKDYAYNAGNKANPIIKKDSYLTWNFTMSKELYDGTRLYGSIENIFDVKNENCRLGGRFLSLGFDHRF